MLDPTKIPFPTVDPNELLARYVFSQRHIDRQAQRVKADAFMPPPNLEMSVTRHRDATQAEIWAVGHEVGKKRDRTMYGRGDVLAVNCQSQKLRIDADPLTENPNHASIVGWPVGDKPGQMLIAKEIAAVAKFVATPNL